MEVCQPSPACMCARSSSKNLAHPTPCPVHAAPQLEDPFPRQQHSEDDGGPTGTVQQGQNRAGYSAVPEARVPLEELLNVDDGPMLERRKLVMNICVIQVLISFVMLVNMRRSPILLVLQPFFVGAGVLGYMGAKHCKDVFVAAHFMGSGGLALVFMFFIVAEAFLKQDKTDLFFFIINFPVRRTARPCLAPTPAPPFRAPSPAPRPIRSTCSCSPRARPRSSSSAR